MKSLIVTAMCLFLANNAYSAEYLVPYDYDNIASSVKSEGYGVINQSSPLSATTWNIGGNAVKYRCISTPIITCSGGTSPVPSVSLSKMVLTKPDAVVANQTALPVLIWDIRYETSGSNYNICAAAVGGTLYDNVDYSGGQLTYTPNQYSETYTYFSSTAITNSTAYIAFNYKQLCQ